MSGIILPTPAYKALDWTAFVTQVEYHRRGFIALSLTNYDNDSVPQIAVGSLVGINFSLFVFASAGSIGGTPQTGTNYIRLEVSGEGNYQTVDAVWTTTTPTWFDSKQGWYDATGEKRYVAMCEYDGATAYTEKRVLGGWRRKVREDHVDDDGTINMVDSSCGLEDAVTRYWSMGTDHGALAPYGCYVRLEGYAHQHYPLHLTHGAVVTGLQAYWGESFTAGEVYLWRVGINASSGEQEMAHAHMETPDTSISYATIDNQNYKYVLVLANDDNVVHTVQGVVITYTIDKVYMS